MDRHFSFVSNYSNRSPTRISQQERATFKGFARVGNQVRRPSGFSQMKESADTIKLAHMKRAGTESIAANPLLLTPVQIRSERSHSLPLSIRTKQMFEFDKRQHPPKFSLNIPADQIPFPELKITRELSFNRTTSKAVRLQMTPDPEFSEIRSQDFQTHGVSSFSNSIQLILTKISNNNKLLFERFIQSKPKLNSAGLEKLFDDFLKYLDVFTKNVTLQERQNN